MPEDQEFKEQPSGDAGEGLERLTLALSRLESLLEQTLADRDALRQEYRQLKLDYQALQARTESVGAGMEAAIDRLKQWMGAENAQENESGIWAK
jgi:hypothetical protein